jgi:hypothetical protein
MHQGESSASLICHILREKILFWVKYLFRDNAFGDRNIVSKGSGEISPELCVAKKGRAYPRRSTDESWNRIRIFCPWLRDKSPRRPTSSIFS